MFKQTATLIFLSSIFQACGDSTPSSTTDATVETGVDASRSETSVANDIATSNDAATGGGRVRVRVEFAGTAVMGSQLQLAGSREMMLMGFPAGFAVVDNPTFPATAELPFSTPGTYWISANLNAPPVSFMPGPEDRIGVSSMPVMVRAGETSEITVTILDRDN
jgi:hypothetical protein